MATDQLRPECPTLGDLLCASGGELPLEAGWAIAAHLKVCASCRQKLTEALCTLSAVAASESYGETTGLRWKSSSPFAAVLHVQQQTRIHQKSPGGLTPWLPIAAVSVVLALGVLLTRATVVVQMDEVLRHAVHAEKLWPVASNRWVRVDVRPYTTRHESRVASLSIEREVGGEATGFNDVMVQRGLPEAVRSVLTGYHLDWQRPMSASPFRRWRAGLRERQDVVTRRRDQIVVQTWTREGPVREAQLVLHRENYHVTRQRWVFDRIGVVEMKEVDAPTVLAGGRPEVARAPGMTATMLDDIEMDARLVLGTLEADLAGARVSRSGPVVRVEGSFASRGQLRAVERRLRGMRDVDLRPSPVTNAGMGRLAVAGAGVARRLDRLGVDAEERRRFVPELHRLTVRVRQRVEVLYALAARYPNDVGVSAPETNAKFRRLLALHFTALNDELASLQSRLAILTGASAPQRSVPLAAVPADWARRAAEGQAEARRLERLVTAMIADDDLELDDVGAGPLSQFDVIWDTFNRVRRR